MDFLNFIILFVGLISYAVIGGNYAYAVHSRARVDGHVLGAIPFLLIASTWPIPVALWLLTCAVTHERRPSPFSLLHERTRLAVKDAEIETARDWERRARHWYAEAERAELEDDQALKWRVAENLAFLLDTQPSGAETPQEKAERIAGMKKINKRTTTDQIIGSAHKAKLRRATSERAFVKPVHLDKSNPAETAYTTTSVSMSSPEIASEIKRLGLVLPGLVLPAAQKDHWVSLCNICARYRERDQLLMEGVCRECAVDLGLK